MSPIEIAIIAAAVVLTGAMGRFFFGPKKTRLAEMDEGVQVVRIKVQGGYSPDVIQVSRGVPVRIEFDRQESGDCSSRVVMPDFRVNRLLPAYATTAVDLVPDHVGSFEFACGMNMIRGRLEVVEGAASAPDKGAASAPYQRIPAAPCQVARLSRHSLAEPQALQASARPAAVDDRARRRLGGGHPTAPIDCTG